MRDEKLLQDLLDIAEGLDQMSNELNALRRTVLNVISTVPVSVDAWEKVVPSAWTKK
jgi:hypothetical protein